ncbi:MAG: hypothetical protein IK082_02925 [Oscillospiraceae bacterium]|nr:hypothetical protein [Oscillospiraceae bacterium]
MALVDAKCKYCKANLKVNDSLEAAICPNCKTPYIVQDAINYYSTTNITNNTTNVEKLYTDKVIMNDDRSVEQRLAAAEQQMVFRDWDEALRIFLEVCETKPQDYRCWWGCARAELEQAKRDKHMFNSNAFVSRKARINHYYERAIMTAPSEEQEKIQQNKSEFKKEMMKIAEYMQERQKEKIARQQDSIARQQDSLEKSENSERQQQEELERLTGQKESLQSEYSNLKSGCKSIPAIIENKTGFTILAYIAGIVLGVLEHRTSSLGWFADIVLVGGLVFGSFFAIVLNIIRVIIRKSMRSANERATITFNASQARLVNKRHSVEEEIKKTQEMINKTKQEQLPIRKHKADLERELTELKRELDAILKAASEESALTP